MMGVILSGSLLTQAKGDRFKLLASEYFFRLENRNYECP
jgi:hypothetical protein